ncbi:MAG: DoxX family protein [Chloroflexi bacterium]|nr:DoxX family protein [Chloroflexota bacterium]
MDALILAGRIMFAIFFLNSGVMHLAKREAMAGYLRSSGGLPAILRQNAKVAVVGTGLMLISGAVMVAAGVYGDVGALVLAAFLVPTSFFLHPFWKDTDPAQRQQNQTAFLRNVAYLGTALFLFGVFSTNGSELGFALTGPAW